MPDSPFRFLLRVLAWLAPGLALWWWLLLNPVLAVIGPPVDLALGTMASNPRLTWSASGPWEVELDLPGTSQVARFGVDRELLQRLTIGLPFVWALLLASGPSGRRWTALLAGTAVALAGIIASSILYLCYHATVIVRQYTTQDTSGLSYFAMNTGGYLGIHVLPYITPIAAWLWLDKKSRNYIAKSFSKARYFGARQE